MFKTLRISVMSTFFFDFLAFSRFQVWTCAHLLSVAELYQLPSIMRLFWSQKRKVSKHTIFYQWTDFRWNRKTNFESAAFWDAWKDLWGHSPVVGLDHQPVPWSFWHLCSSAERNGAGSTALNFGLFLMSKTSIAQNIKDFPNVCNFRWFWWYRNVTIACI